MKNLKKNIPLILFCLPGVILFLFVSYIPMFGILIAFKDYKIYSRNFLYNLYKSDFIGFKNFEFFFKNNDFYLITRNTILYNIVFIILNIVISIIIAYMVHELLRKKLAKMYQTFMFLPYFLSWVVISYCLFAFLSPDKGLINKILQTLSIQPISWYENKKYWPFILVFMNVWKNLGYNTVIFLAAFSSIDPTYYEVSLIEGASKFKQLIKITIPLISPVIIVVFILSLGNIFRADFGLFYQLPLNSGPLHEVTDVIDTYIFRALIQSGDIGLSSAVSLIQSIIGCVLILFSNKIVSRYDKQSSIF